MYRQLGISSGFGNLDLGKTANIVLENLDFPKKIFGYTIETSPDHVAKAILENSLKQFVPEEMPPEVSDYLSRNTLRSIVGLSPIEIGTIDKDAIRKLKGSISWLSKGKIDVTEIIRQMREC